MVDRRVEDPAGDMLADLEAGKIDAALLWGPIGGPLVKQGASAAEGDAAPEGAGAAAARLPHHHGGAGRARTTGSASSTARSARNQAEIDAILRDAGVPILDDFGKGGEAGLGAARPPKYETFGIHWLIEILMRNISASPSVRSHG